MAIIPVVEKDIIPNAHDFEKLLTAKLSYEAAQKAPNKDAWNKKHFTETPWGIAYTVSKARYDKSVANAKAKNWSNHNGYKQPAPKNDLALKYFIIAVAIDWQELIEQLKRTLKNWEYTTRDLQGIAKTVWQDPVTAQAIATACSSASVTKLIEQLQVDNEQCLTEAVEKHDTLNTKLFTKEELLKDRVRDKMLEIVDEFLNNLKEQDVKIKVEDIIFIGSNASYNYTKDSDIDLHIIANTKAVNYPETLGSAIYSAYRTLFNKQLDIKLFDIPVEIFVEIEDSPRVSNGVYSVKKNKWVKKPVHEDIPDYDKESLNALVDKWEDKCKKLIDDIKADKLDDEKRVVKMLEDIYDKLRKKGVAKGEYSTENLAFKELRNKGYLDKLKDYKNELTSKRLSLEEKLDRQTRADIYNQLARVASTQPIIQDNGMFFVYNLKSSEVNRVLSTIRSLPFVTEAQANENGKYDFSNTLELAMNKMPTKYYNIRGKINY
jgi:predicted nucleotidyltransferase